MISRIGIASSNNTRLSTSCFQSIKKSFKLAPIKSQYKVFSTGSNESLPFSKIGVVGLGLMGHGICQVSATAAASSSNCNIIAYETDEKFLLKGKERIEKSLSKLISKEKLTQEDGDNIMNSITFTTDKDSLVDSDFIVEAIIENLQIKKDLYKELDAICDAKTIFASNTSSLSITEMSTAVPTLRQERFMGIHFFNPVQIMKLVEVIQAPMTSPDIVQQVQNWVKSIKKVPVSCGDTPGFIVNRLLVPNMAQAMLMVDRGDATVTDIDLSMQLGAGNPMGPLHLADYVGLDTCFFILKGWVDQYPNEPAFVIPECLKQKVDAGDFGRKSGKGFYYWDGEKRGDAV